MKLRRLKRFIGDESGSELLEFALTATLFLTTILCIADVCRAMYFYHFVTYAAQEGARYATVRGADWNSSCNSSAPPNFTMNFDCSASRGDVSNFVKSLGSVNSSNLNVDTTWTGTTPDCSSNCSACTTANDQGCMVQVKVSYTFTFMTPFLKQKSINLYGTSEQVIQQ